MVTETRNRPDPVLFKLVAVVLLGGIMGILDGTMVAVGADTLRAAFAAPLTTIGWVSTGYLLALTATIPITAWAADRFGGRRLWLFGLVLFLGASLACGLAWDVPALIVFRVFQGVGAGVLDPLVLILLARAAGPGRAGRVMALMAGVLSLGPVLGPVVGGVVLQGLGWRWLFLINLPIGLAALAGSVRLLPADAPGADRPRARLDVIGAAAVTPGFGAVVLALSRAGDRAGFASPAVLVPLAAGAVLLAAYAVRALRVRHTPPLIDLRLFARPGFAPRVAIMAVTGLAMFALLFALPLYYQQARGAGALTAGLLVAPFGVSSAVAAPLAGRLAARFGTRAVVRTGALVAAAGAYGFTWTGAAAPGVWPVLAAVGVGAGLGFVGAPTMGSLYEALPAALVPQGSSVLYMLNQLGASFGVAVVALVVQTAGRADPVRGFHGAAWFLTAAALVLAVAAGGLQASRRKASPSRTT
jgi:EmrB/QacA subfamily drug resistance transporter